MNHVTLAGLPSNASAPKGATGMVYYTFEGVEDAVAAPAGPDRWLAVARALGTRLNCTALTEGVPAYDAGTRAWTLPLTLHLSHRRSKIVLVSVRW